MAARIEPTSPAPRVLARRNADTLGDRAGADIAIIDVPAFVGGFEIAAAGERGHALLKRDRGRQANRPRGMCGFPQCWTGGRLAVISPATKRLTSPYLLNWEKSNVDNDEQQLPVHRKQGLWPD